MCEILLAVWPEPQPFARVLPWGLELERFGVAGFGWGAAWREGGRVRCHRDLGRLADDHDGQARLRRVQSTHFLLHLRRPSRLSTVALADTHPFLPEDGSFAFCHNGRLEGASSIRQRFQSKLHGRADSEVGFRLFESRLAAGSEPAEALALIHDEMGGTANLVYLPARGPALVYAGNKDNAFWRFRLDGAEVASTALHSADESVFSLCFPSATERGQVAAKSVAQLGGNRPAQLAEAQGIAPTRN